MKKLKSERDFEKLKERMKKYRAGDGDELLYNPIEKRRESLLSLGKIKDVKSLKTSYKQRLGKTVNKNVHKRYDSIEKMRRRFERNREAL